MSPIQKMGTLPDDDAGASGGRYSLLFLLMAGIAIVFIALIDAFGMTSDIIWALVITLGVVFFVVYRGLIQGKPLVPSLGQGGSSKLPNFKNNQVIVLVIIAAVILLIIYYDTVSTVVIGIVGTLMNILTTLALVIMMGVAGFGVGFFYGGGFKGAFLGAGVGVVLGVIIASIFSGGITLFDFDLDFCVECPSLLGGTLCGHPAGSVLSGSPASC